MNTYNIVQEISLHTVITHYKTTASAREYPTTNGEKNCRGQCACVQQVCMCRIHVKCRGRRSVQLTDAREINFLAGIQRAGPIPTVYSTYKCILYIILLYYNMCIHNNIW